MLGVHGEVKSKEFPQRAEAVNANVCSERNSENADDEERRNVDGGAWRR